MATARMAARPSMQVCLSIMLLLVGVWVAPMLAHAYTYGEGLYGDDIYNGAPGTAVPTGGGPCVNCDSSNVSSSGSGESALPATTTPPSQSTATTTPFHCAETGTASDGLSPAGLVNLLVSLGIIPSDKAQAACDVQTLPPTNTSTSAFFQFTHSLRLGQHADDVRRLQAFLNSLGFVITREGPGAPGNETDFFGVLTFDAVKRLQAAYRDEILSPVGLTTPSGFFGQSTMKKANAILRGEQSPAVWGLPLVP